MPAITPHLWFDTQAREAAEFYAEVFPESAVTSVTTMTDTPSGDCDIVSFTVWGHPFMAISAGPVFTINPSISFMVNFDPSHLTDAAELIDQVWERLIDGGEALMPIGEYPFSKRYGWVQDRYGVSWQLILTDPSGDPRPTIIPSLLFVGDGSGQAEPAVDHYLSVFDDSERGQLVHYPEGMAPHTAGTVMFSDFRIGDQWFTAMDGLNTDHRFTFNEAVSLMVHCADQVELDHYSDALSAVPEAEQCGWLKDSYGVSWQIVPTEMETLMTTGTPEQIARVTQAFMQQKRFDLAALRAAFSG